MNSVIRSSADRTYCALCHVIQQSMSMLFFPSRSPNAVSRPLSTLELPRFRPRLSVRCLGLVHENTVPNETVPFRKQLKDEAKRRRAAGEKAGRDIGRNKARQLDRWELTVGIEIHAQLNTDRKLFSSGCNAHLDGFSKANAIEEAATSINDEPNSNVSVFDLALPGTQPVRLSSYDVLPRSTERHQRSFRQEQWYLLFALQLHSIAVS